MDASANRQNVSNRDVSRRHWLRIRRVSPLIAASLAVIASCTSVATSASAPVDPAERIAEGRRYADLRCASCHALDGQAFSPNAAAPPMSRLLPALTFKMLVRGSAREAEMAHGAMPPLRLSVLERDALTAYLESIADPPVR